MDMIKRRDFLKKAGLGAAALVAPHWLRAAEGDDKPNIVFILADDLGYGDLGCYGQTKIRTPNVDHLASEGIRFTQYYAGHTVCAPSRCSLLTGLHTGHAFIRDNREVGTWNSFQGQLPLPEGTRTMAHALQQRGYATACIGKWGLGGVGTSGDPLRQGFDHFFGINCQRQAHNYYPTYIIRDREQVPLEGNDGKSPTGRQYAPDLMTAEALAFIRGHKDQPFFLHFTTPIPHLALQVPEDSLAEYRGQFPEIPYNGKKGYQPHPTPRAAYAAMITRLDRDVGKLLALLKELGIAERTIVCFASDNGATFDVGGADANFFQSNGPLNGRKQDLLEGGIRVPLIVCWPGRIPAARTTDQIAAAWDIFPTLAAATGAEAPANMDGVSLMPTLLGQSGQQQHEYLYWESSGLNSGEQAVRWGDWKGVRTGLRKNRKAPLKLFNLKTDVGETHDVAQEHPDIVAKILDIMKTAHTPSKAFPLPGE